MNPPFNRSVLISEGQRCESLHMSPPIPKQTCTSFASLVSVSLAPHVLGKRLGSPCTSVHSSTFARSITSRTSALCSNRKGLRCRSLWHGPVSVSVSVQSLCTVVFASAPEAKDVKAQQSGQWRTPRHHPRGDRGGDRFAKGAHRC